MDTPIAGSFFVVIVSDSCTAAAREEVLGFDWFGASAPGERVLCEYGLAVRQRWHPRGCRWCESTLVRAPVT